MILYYLGRDMEKEQIELNYKVYGQGDPIIILHGLFGSLDNWASFAKKLSTDYMVFLIDLRDHGRSPHTESFNYQLLAEDLHRFMEDNWMFKAHLMGHSMGGKAAMQFANDFPDYLDKLIVVDIAPKSYPPRHVSVFEAIKSIDLKKLENRMDALDILKIALDDATAAFLTKNIRRTDQGFKWKMNVDLLMNNYEEISEGIDVNPPYNNDVLFIRGERSEYILDEDMEDIKHKFPNAKLETIQDSGHWIHAEKPQELLELVTQFLKIK